jgi:hypothetical protein
MKNYSFFFIILCIANGFSQSETKTSESVELDFFYGKLIEHDKKLKKDIQGDPFGFLISWNYIKSQPSIFDELYNYPERGYSFLYENFNSDTLGEVFGAYRHFTYNLTPNNRNQLKLTTGFGIGYATMKYDEVSNGQNHAIGSNLLASLYVKLNYLQLYKDNKLRVNSALSLIHFSNISFKNPNLGINTVALNVGVTYDFQEREETISDRELLKPVDSKVAYNLIIRSGVNESLIIDSGLFPFYTLTFYGSKKLNHYSTVTAGVDFFNSRFLKEYIKYLNNNEGGNYNGNDYNRGGIFIGHELIQNNFSFISQIGYTFYSPVPYMSKIYERFGFKYKLSTHLFSEVTMKVNLFRAEALELGIGYKF